jgi:UbiA prenyltransferase family protein
MKPKPNKLRSLLALSRPDVLPALVSGQWLMVFLAFGVEPAIRRNPALDGMGIALSLVCSAVIAGGLGVFMMAMNDALDARHDRAFEPDRPIPSGRVTQRAALGVAMAGLLAALGAAVAFGPVSIVLALVAAGAIVFYNVAGRFVPAVGVVTLGLVIGVTVVIPNPRLAFAWPILLTMTHVIAAATLRYFLAGKRPRLTPINGWGICVGWAFWILVVIVLIRVRGEGVIYEGLGLIWVGPALAAVGFGLLAWLMLGPSAMQPRARRRTAARFARLATTWLIVFHTSWLLSAGLWWQGLVLLIMIFVSLMWTPD